MKTKEELEVRLYRKTKLNRVIAIAMEALFSLGVLIDIVLRINGTENHLGLTFKTIGVIFVLVYIGIIGIWVTFFSPSEIDKEVKKITKKIDQLKEEKDLLEKMAISESENRINKKIYQKKFERIKRRIWELEWKLKQMGISE